MDESIQKSAEPIRNLDMIHLSKPIEHYWPKNNNTLLFHGTSKNGSDSIENNGFATGMFTTSLVESFGARFYRGALIIAENNPDTFKVVTTNGAPDTRPPTYYDIKIPDNALDRLIRTTSVDTDNVHSTLEGLVQTQTDLKSMGSVQLTEEQQAFFGDIITIFNEYKIEDIDQKKMEALEKQIVLAGFDISNREKLDMNKIQEKIYIDKHKFHQYAFIYPLQLRLAELIGINADSFSSREEFQKAIDKKYSTEEEFIQSIFPKFPGRLTWGWKKFDMDDNQVFTKIVLQLYQNTVINRIEDVVTSDTIPKKIEFKKGENIQGY